MALTASITFLFLSAFIAAANICGCFAAYRRARRNVPGGYSNVAIFSLVFSTCSWALSRDQIGLWAFVPTLVDPGTWSLVYLPFFLVRQRSRKKPSSD